ncbi:MAG: glycosyltransferase family 87 protein [Bacteroidales bacterium]|nr:glycosyltransferase family 87 protein [Bacteroidales bacterium]
MTIIKFTIGAIINSKEQYDFMCFYMQGQLGVHNMNFYDPGSFQILLAKINYPLSFEQNKTIGHFVFHEGIKNEILNVGLLSPPITMLFFAPLASFDYQSSRNVFSVLVAIFIILNAVLANIVFLKKERSIFSFLLIFIIIAVIPGTYNTIYLVQTNFFLLFFLMLSFYKIDKPISGFYLALSVIFKPISGILLLYFIINKKWKTVTWFSVSIVILLLITCFLWGFDNLASYIISPPTQRLPHSIYTQVVNQSLIGLLNRNLEIYGLSDSAISFLYFSLSGIMILITLLASKNLQKVNPQFSFLSFIPLMLLIYPSSLIHYMVYLIPVFLYFIFLKNGGKYLWIILVPAFIFLSSETFFSYLIIWMMFLYAGLFRTKNDKFLDKLSDLSLE